MVITFLSESGELLRDEWKTTEPTDSAPMMGDQVIMNDPELMAVTSRTSGSSTLDRDEFRTVYLTLRKVE